MDPYHRYLPEVSELVSASIPEFYREQAPRLIDFLVAYYEWMESPAQATYYARRLLDYGDVDATILDFLPHFRRKYVPDVDLNSAADPRLLVKKALDLYRARGTPLAWDLFMRLVYGAGAEVYYPKRDLFRTSSGDWRKPRYLEIAEDVVDGFVGRRVTGLSSGAQAFVERRARKRHNGRIVRALFVSGVDGTFIPGEVLQSSTGARASLLGSLGSLEIVEGGSGFAVGDIAFAIGEEKGYAGLARISGVRDASGLAQFTLLDGGYGYTMNAAVLVSSHVITTANLVPGASVIGTNAYYSVFETVSQPIANINYISSTGSFSNNDAVSFQNTTAGVIGTGFVIGVTPSNSTAGFLRCSVWTGTANGAKVNSASVSANIAVVNGYSNATVTANLFAEADDVALVLDTVSNNAAMAIGQAVTDGLASAVVNTLAISLAVVDVTVNQRVGIISPNTVISGPGWTANVESVAPRLGIKDANGTFVTHPLAKCFCSVSNTQFFVGAVSGGAGASYAVGSLAHQETIGLNVDYLHDYVGVFLGSGGYGFPADPTANAATYLHDALTNQTITIGSIASITNVSEGAGYDAAPLTRVFEHITWGTRQNGDWRIDVANLTASFAIGELVEQTSTGSLGLVRDIQNGGGTLYVRRLSLLDDFAQSNSANHSTQVTGLTTGANANIVVVGPRDVPETLDADQPIVGLDAVVNATVVTAPGSVVTAEVVDSGFAFTTGEVTLIGSGNPAVGVAQIIGVGTGSGRFQDPGSRPSSDKRLLDSDYWQDYSYDVRSPIDPDKYRDSARRVLHMAGTRQFGSILYHAQANSQATVVSATVTTA